MKPLPRKLIQPCTFRTTNHNLRNRNIRSLYNIVIYDLYVQWFNFHTIKLEWRTAFSFYFRMSMLLFSFARLWALYVDFMSS